VGDPVLRLRSSGLSWRTVDGRVVALDLHTSAYFALNPTGSVIWRRLGDGDTLTGLVDAIVDEFDVPPERAEPEVASFVDTLRSRGLLK
jgi:hypothetical protein